MNAEELFAEALAKEPGERTGFLDQVCADDPELREKVERLMEEYLRSQPLSESMEANTSAAALNCSLKYSATPRDIGCSYKFAAFWKFPRSKK